MARACAPSEAESESGCCPLPQSRRLPSRPPPPRRIARERGERPDRPRLAGDAPAELRDRVAGLRNELREARYEPVAIPPQLESIAACESGGDPTAIGGGGLYRGKYQFDMGTWASVGGSGDPAAASEAEQDMRAAMLYARAGATPWPVCG